MDVDICTPVAVGALVTPAEVWKPAMCQSVEERIKKMRKDKKDALYLYNGMLLSLKQEGNSDTCCNMSEPRGHCAQ